MVYILVRKREEGQHNRKKSLVTGGCTGLKLYLLTASKQVDNYLHGKNNLSYSPWLNQGFPNGRRLHCISCQICRQTNYKRSLRTVQYLHPNNGVSRVSERATNVGVPNITMIKMSSIELWGATTTMGASEDGAGVPRTFIQ